MMFHFTKRRMGWVVLLLLILPMVAFAQTTPQSALTDNANFLESLGLLGGMAIAPFAALFVTSLISVLGLGNQFIAENPVLGNWITVIISGILTFAPLLPKVLKSTAVIGQAIDWLSDRAGAVVGIIVLASPYFNELTQNEELQEVSLGFINLDSTPMFFLTLAVAIPYFIVVMTVRSFFGILIFLSPIPIVDALFEVIKQGVSIGMIVLYLVWPEAALALTGVVFLISFFLFRKAKRMMTFFKYLYLRPLGRALGFGKTDLVPSHLPRSVNNHAQQPSLAIEVVLKNAFHVWRKRQIVWLIISKNEVSLIQPKWFGMTETVHLGNVKTVFSNVERRWSHFVLKGETQNLQLQLNLTFSSKVDEIERLFGIENDAVNNEAVPKLGDLAIVFGQSS